MSQLKMQKKVVSSLISAFIELNHKVMLFAGIKSADEGLFFAKVDKLVSHITETVKNLEN